MLNTCPKCNFFIIFSPKIQISFDRMSPKVVWAWNWSKLESTWEPLGTREHPIIITTTILLYRVMITYMSCLLHVVFYVFKNPTSAASNAWTSKKRTWTFCFRKRPFVSDTQPTLAQFSFLAILLILPLYFYMNILHFAFMWKMLP